ncbi:MULTISPECIES: DMT family transporter [unclassified Treponema]|uniref:DMT family transporter n=1 Tax=unclassified Treponema TaxID=2638727 RepID=UPI0020A34E84|nr:MULTISPECIES: DMT family transporter [unclassified Treponema]UTC66738.1 DMT family transporter [Treponema sp. OMZ 789]UTC69470.1 DMT family transporter [Treponema sp. OMZ 790]UTC72184.1 DMT family transporter [Treponema sp. OMZ 791]
MKLTSKQKGIMFLIFSALCFASMNLLAKLAGDLPSMQKAFFRNLIAAVVSFAVLIRSKEKFNLDKKNLPFFFMRAIFGTMGIVGNFYAIEHMLLADASILAKLAPFFAILFSFLFLKEKIKLYQILAVITAFSASLLIIKPAFADKSHVIAALIGAFGGMMAGAAYTCVRYLSIKKEKGATIVFFFSFCSILILLPVFIIFYHPMSLLQTITLLIAGLVGTGGQFCVTAAYAHAPAGSISVYDYTQIVFSALFGFAFLGELPDRWSFLGFAIIFAVALFMFLHHEDKVKKHLGAN